MNKIIETENYKLISISKNLYKIEMKTDNFTKDNSKQISGCYFSESQKTWVFPKNEISLKQFEDLFKNNNVIIENIQKNNLEVVVDKEFILENDINDITK